MTNIKELLPIGSIVLLKDSKKRLMISGIRQTGKEQPEKEYDYMGVLYPEGHIGDEYNFLFNQEDIEQIFFRGFQDIERQDFLDRLSDYYEKSEKQEA